MRFASYASAARTSADSVPGCRPEKGQAGYGL